MRSSAPAQPAQRFDFLSRIHGVLGRYGQWVRADPCTALFAEALSFPSRRVHCRASARSRMRLCADLRRDA